MFHKIINLIKLNYNVRNEWVKTIINKNDFKIVRVFLQLNIIKMVKKQSNNCYLIYFKYEENGCIFKNIKNIYKPSKPVFMTLAQINKINKKNNRIFLLSTNKGLLTNYEAELKKTGGIVILTITT